MRVFFRGERMRADGQGRSSGRRRRGGARGGGAGAGVGPGKRFDVGWWWGIGCCRVLDGLNLDVKNQWFRDGVPKAG